MKKKKQYNSMKEAIKDVDNKWELIAFIFAYRSKELMFLIIVILVVLQLYPSISNFITDLFK